MQNQLKALEELDDQMKTETESFHDTVKALHSKTAKVRPD
jgi:hypothetical protein